MIKWYGNGGGWGGDAPVYDVDFDDLSDDSYPAVWITVQVHEPTPTRTGRDCISLYTGAGDLDGRKALSYGARYYDEGMACPYEGDWHEKRIMCFQAAELLYLHAARKGNPIAHLNLGYVYSYNRCEGKYWGWWESPYIRDDVQSGRRVLIPYPHEERALEHFRVAAEAGLAEACYKYGDLLRDGRGCEPDPVAAFGQFQRAYDLGRGERPTIWGSAALRLGHAYEEGEGCYQSFEEARRWYLRAVSGLDIAVRSGDEWYRRSLRRAEDGLARVEQELDGSY